MESVLIIILLALITFWIYAFVRCLRQTTFRFMSKESWMVIIFVFSVIGALLYFVLERGSQHESKRNASEGDSSKAHPYTIDEARKELRRPDVLIGLVFSILYLGILTVRAFRTGDTFALRVGLSYALIVFLLGQLLLRWFRRRNQWSIRIGSTMLTFKQLNVLLVLVSLLVYGVVVTFFLPNS